MQSVMTCVYVKPVLEDYVRVAHFEGVRQCYLDSQKDVVRRLGYIADEG